MNILTWSKDWECVQLDYHKEPVLVVDPGVDGAAICADADGNTLETFSLKRHSAYEVGAEMERSDISTVIMEDQFVGRNAKTVMHLRLSVGIFLGQIDNVTARDITVIFVMPKVWQNVILPTCKGRAELKAGARMVVRETDLIAGVEAGKRGEFEWKGIIPTGWTKAELSGFWDAQCISDWWTHCKSPEVEG